MVAVWLMVVCLPIQRDDLAPFQFGLGSMRFSEVLAVVSVGLIVAGAVLRGEQGRIRFPVRATLLIAGLLAAMLLSAFMSLGIDWTPGQFVVVRRLSREVPVIKSYTTIVAWMFGIASFFALVLAVTSARRLKIALKWWIVGGTVCSMVGIYSAPAAFFGWPLGDAIGLFWRGDGEGSLLPRIRGLAQEPRHLAILLVSLLPLLYIATARRVYLMRPWLQRLCMVVCGVAYVLTLSRSTVVFGAVLLVLLPIFLALTYNRRGLSKAFRPLLQVAGFVAALFAAGHVMLKWFGLPGIIATGAIQFQSLGDTRHLSNWQQEMAWTIAWRAFHDHPALGVGVGNLTFYADMYIPAKPEWAYWSQYWAVVPVNNVYLDIAAETGMVGLGAFGLLLGYFGVTGWRTMRASGPTARVLLAGLLLGYTMLVLSFVFFSAFHFAYVWAAIGLLFVTGRLAQTNPSELERSFRARGSLAPGRSVAR